MRAHEWATNGRSATRIATIAVTIAGLSLAACSSDDDGVNGDGANETSTDAGSTSTSEAAVTTTTQPTGPSAELSTELTAGQGVYLGEGTPPDFDAIGYVQSEYSASGTATSYTNDGALTGDGVWNFVPDVAAPFTTRVIVRAPEADADFSGTVIVEWLNVSGGVDANPEWASVAEEIVRAGHVWVGVSAQRIGVEGGPVLVAVEGVPGADDQGKGLKVIDPDRYGALEHPGDGYSFDIFTQVARAIGTGAGLHGLEPQRLIAAGESQSAFALVSYYNGVQPLADVFDGFFVHSRGASALPLVAPGAAAGIADAIAGTATIFRTDLDTPVLDIQTEGDVASILNSYAARQPDTDQFRLWEVAGTAHADAHLVGAGAQYIECGVPINDGPMHLVAKAALRALITWLDTGTPPASAPRLDVVDDGGLQVQRDADGIALGGIRTPPIDVPVATLSGAPGPEPSTICLLLGSTTPLTPARLAELYESSDEYQQSYEAAADATIAAGYALEEDRDALIAFADASVIATS
jgi:hypothetical protein